MKGNIARTTLGILFIATLCLSMASTTQAEGPACSLTRAAGKYADSISSVGLGPYAAVELLTADAAGNINGKQTSSSNGSVIRSTISGTYTVDPDCTGTVRFSRFDESGNLLSTGTLDLVWDDNMREVRFVFTSIVLPDGTPIPVVIKGEGRKLFPGSSNQQ